MTWLALPWVVLTTTGSPGKMTLVLASEAARPVLMGLPGGTVGRGARRAVARQQRGRFLDGFRFIARDRLLRGWCVAFITGDAAWMAFFAAVPVLVVADYGADPRIAGWIFSSFGVGAVIGNVLAYRLQGRTDGLSLVTALVYGQALPLWVLVFHVPAAAIVGAIFVSGFFNGVVNPAIHTLLTLSSPPAIRARVMPALSA